MRGAISKKRGSQPRWPEKVEGMEKSERARKRKLDTAKTDVKKVHSLIDKVYKRKNLEMAWEEVKENRGSGGVDGQSPAEVDRCPLPAPAAAEPTASPAVLQSRSRGLTTRSSPAATPYRGAQLSQRIHIPRSLLLVANDCHTICRSAYCVRNA